MTLSTDLIAISSVAVGGGTQYPVVSSRVTTRFEGPEGQDTEAYRVETWELTCHAFAADTASLSAKAEQVRSDLCKRGLEVELTEFTGSRTLPAAGGAAGSMAGYPTVELADDPARSFGTLLTFTLRCEARIPQPDVGNVVEHDWERTEETDEDGLVRITQRGTYRTKNTVDAQTHAQTNVIDAEEADAASNNRNFRIRWTLGPDTAVAGYEFVATDKDYSGDPGVTEAQLTDRTSANNEGRVVRVISGYAVGSGAQAWVDGQAPTPDATNILTRKETSPATVPEGRINFLWELLTGVSDPQFPNITLFGFSEALDVAPEVERLVFTSYLNADPVGRYAELAPSTYAQRTSIDFLGTWADGIAAVTGLFDDENLVTTPRRSYRSGPHGIKTLEYSAVYQYATPLTPVPTPREIPELSA